MAKAETTPSTSEQTAEPACEEIIPVVELVSIELNKQGQLVRKTSYLHQNPWPAATPWPATDSPGAAAPPQKLSGKAWVPIAFDRRRGELRAMSITDASGALAHESKAAPDCAKQLKPRYIEKLLRGLDVWPKARRNSSKQRPK
jgi:hypothetical protein